MDEINLLKLIKQIEKTAQEIERNPLTSELKRKGYIYNDTITDYFYLSQSGEEALKKSQNE